MNNKSIGNIFKGDKVIWMVFFFLCMISIVEVYSASSSLSYKTGNYMAPVIRHILLFGRRSVHHDLHAQGEMQVLQDCYPRRDGHLITVARSGLGY